jgi:hypothetical protein
VTLAAAGAPLSERLCDGVCFVIALWTLCCHAVVALGGTLTALLVLYALTGGAVGTVVWALRRRGAGSPAAPPPAEPCRAHLRPRRILQGAGLVLGLCAVLAFARYGSTIALWWSIVVLLTAAGVAFVLRVRPQWSPSAGGPAREVGLWILAFICVALTLVAHRPDPDDAFYVNVAVAAARDCGPCSWEPWRRSMGSAPVCC